MRRQLVTMGIGVRGMSWGKGRFRDCLMLLMRQGVFCRVVAGIFQVTFTVHTRACFHCYFPNILFRRCFPWGHTQ